MDSEYSVSEMLDFLKSAADRGIMPAATARALAVASRQVMSILNEDEGRDVRRIDLDALVKRFSNKRAKDFNPTSLHEYGRRARKAVELFTAWRANPAGFSVKTRSTGPVRRRTTAAPVPTPAAGGVEIGPSPLPQSLGSGYQSSFPIRPGHVVTLSNIPADLTKQEAERLAQFVRLLALA